MPYEIVFGFDEPAPIFMPPPVAVEADQIARLRLIRSQHVGPATYLRLMDAHGSAQEALGALPAIAQAAGVDSYTPSAPNPWPWPRSRPPSAPARGRFAWAMPRRGQAR